jgi:DNA-binding winged helix-turn-helix (wHTH) protein
MSGHPPRLFEFGPFAADPAKRILRQHGEIVPITGKAFDLLLVLLERAGELVEKNELIRLVWGDAAVEESNLVRHVSMLRKALGDDLAEHRYIVTATGHGYRFVADVTASRDGPAVAVTARQPARRSPGALIAGALLGLLFGALALLVWARRRTEPAPPDEGLPHAAAHPPLSVGSGGGR